MCCTLGLGHELVEVLDWNIALGHTLTTLFGENATFEISGHSQLKPQNPKLKQRDPCFIDEGPQTSVANFTIYQKLTMVSILENYSKQVMSIIIIWTQRLDVNPCLPHRLDNDLDGLLVWIEGGHIVESRPCAWGIKREHKKLSFNVVFVVPLIWSMIRKATVCKITQILCW